MKKLDSKFKQKLHDYVVPPTPLLEEQILKVLNDLWVDVEPERHTDLWSGCITFGMINRTAKDAIICTNPLCQSCRLWGGWIDENAKNLKK